MEPFERRTKKTLFWQRVKTSAFPSFPRTFNWFGPLEAELGVAVAIETKQDGQDCRGCRGGRSDWTTGFALCSVVRRWEDVEQTERNKRR